MSKGHFMDCKDFIKARQDTMLGKPVVKSSRRMVAFILQKLAEGATIEDLKAGYPMLSHDTVLAAIVYESDLYSNETLIAAA